MPKDRESPLERARRLGVKDPHLLMPSDLRQAVRLYEEMEDLRTHASAIGISLPNEGNIGTLVRQFREEVAKRLEGIGEGSAVPFHGKEWRVKSIRPIHGRRRESRMFVLLSEAGRVVSVPDSTLLGHIYRGTN
jgi:hypothetical protein